MSRPEAAAEEVASKSTWEQAAAFLTVIDGDLPLFKDADEGRDPDQALYVPRALTAPSASAAAQLSSVSGFHIFHNTAFDHHKEDRKQGQLDKAVDTPRPTPPEAPGVVVSTSQDDDHEQEDVSMPSVANTGANDTPPPSSDKSSLGFNEQDDDPESALDFMDTQFSKWSHNQREGIDAVIGDVMRASSDINATLVGLDKKTWTKTPDVLSQATNVDEPEDTAGAADLQDLGHHGSKGKMSTQSAPGEDIISTKDGSLKEQSLLQEPYASKRAAMIAKSKAASNKSIVAGQSANQKRAALQKSKNRKLVDSDSGNLFG